ncbi:excisionase [Endozoicomonas acroporae]|uniref:excisionase n=1 Tax=Endozoicomonas acroporae TaxID=1701104 RepID=UPI001F5069CF|nr:excisionase [Endozoicomonas acroporae]
MVDYVRIEKFCELTGWSESWVRKRISKQVWQEGREYVHLPGNRIVVSIRGYEAWVETALVSEQSATAPSKSVSPIRECDAAKGSSLSPRPLI